MRRQSEEINQLGHDEDDSLVLDQLHKVYTAGRVPVELPARFEEALALRRANSQVRRSAFASVLRSSARPLLAGGFVVVIALAAAVAALALPGNGRSNSVAEALAFLNTRVPDRLDVAAGEVIHFRQEIYFRYGSKAADIAAATGIASEERIVEGWQEVGPNDTVVRSYVRTTDASGNVVQISILSPESGWRTYDPRTGSIIREAPYEPQTITAPKTRATEYSRALSEGVARVLSQDGSSLTLELKETLPERARNKEWATGSFQVPFTGDLEPVGLLTRTTLSDTGVVVLAEGFAVTSGGKKVLIQSERTTLFETLDEMPEGLF